MNLSTSVIEKICRNLGFETETQPVPTFSALLKAFDAGTFNAICSPNLNHSGLKDLDRYDRLKPDDLPHDQYQYLKIRNAKTNFVEAFIIWRTTNSVQLHDFHHIPYGTIANET